jgi:hypothetical protein
MDPGLATCPPKILTPSRRPAESRPLDVDPPAFLVAMLRVVTNVTTEEEKDGDDDTLGAVTTKRERAKEAMMV